MEHSSFVKNVLPSPEFEGKKREVLATHTQPITVDTIMPRETAIIKEA